MIVAGIVRQLLAQTSITDGQYGVDRQIWPGSAPQVNVYPRIVVTKISGSEDTHQGSGINLGRARIQITVFARTYTQAANAMKNVVNYLNGIRNTTLPNSVLLKGADMEEFSETEFVNQPRDAAEKPIFQHSGDFLVAYDT